MSRCPNKDVKQVIVMRKDLGMRKGKMIAQGAHASLGVILKHKLQATFTVLWPDTPMNIWLKGSFVKIVVGVDSEEELLEIKKQIVLRNRFRKDKIPYCLITDSGKTEFNGVPTNTCMAIGPWWSKQIDNFTGDLKLL